MKERPYNVNVEGDAKERKTFSLYASPSPSINGRHLQLWMSKDSVASLFQRIASASLL